MSQDKLKPSARPLDIETKVVSIDTSTINFFADKRLDLRNVLSLGVSQVVYNRGNLYSTSRFPLVIQMLECEQISALTEIDHYYFDRYGKILSHTYDKFDCRTRIGNTLDLSYQRLIKYWTEIKEMLNHPKSLPEPLKDHPTIIKLKQGDLSF
jgi:hypothetical protein